MSSRFLKQSLLAASVITIGANVFGRLFGYLREAVIAGYFGTSANFDTFLIAFTVPELFTFVIFAALPMALIPQVQRVSAAGPAEESKLFWSGYVATAIPFAAISAGIYLLRNPILAWLAPDLTGKCLTTARSLVTVLSWVVLFRGLEAYFRGWLHAKKHFIVPATSSMLINIVILVAIYLLYGRLDIVSLAWGWMLGSAAAFLYNGMFALAVVRPAGFAFSSRATSVLLRVFAGVAVVEAIALIYPAVDRFLATRYLGEGQISALRYAVFLIHVPTGIFVVSFNFAAFPWIADLSVRDERERIAELYTRSVRLLLYGMVLIAAGVIVFAEEIVTVAFKRGAFDTESLVLTTGPLVFYALGIVFYSIYFFQMRFYYARTLLVRLGVYLLLMLAIKVVLSLALVGPLEHNGLALATSVAWAAGFVIMTADLRGRLEVSTVRLFFPAILKVFTALLGAVVVWSLLAWLWPHDANATIVAVLVRLIVMGLAGSLVYVWLGARLGLREPSQLVGSIRSRLGRGSNSS